ncbi:MAG: hypothetical protein LW847_16060, partial [Burkholderiales bacterium]|nr:hypothetical protein [Burkholderiales bacterium]
MRSGHDDAAGVLGAHLGDRVEQDRWRRHGAATIASARRRLRAYPPRMRFEHLIEINDPLMPLLTPLTRAQLWRG